MESMVFYHNLNWAENQSSINVGAMSCLHPLDYLKLLSDTLTIITPVPVVRASDTLIVSVVEEIAMCTAQAIVLLANADPAATVVNSTFIWRIEQTGSGQRPARTRRRPPCAP